MAMMSGRGSGDKAGEASFTPEVPSGYLKHSAWPKSCGFWYYANREKRV